MKYYFTRYVKSGSVFLGGQDRDQDLDQDRDPVWDEDRDREQDRDLT